MHAHECTHITSLSLARARTHTHTHTPTHMYAHTRMHTLYTPRARTSRTPLPPTRGAVHIATLMCTGLAGRARGGATDSTARRPVGPGGRRRLNRLQAADSAARSRFNRTSSSGPVGPTCRLARLGPVLPEASRRPGRPPGPLRPAAGRFDRDGAAPPRPDDGAIPSRSLRAVFASPIRRRSPTKKLRSPRFTTTRQFKLPP